MKIMKVYDIDGHLVCCVDVESGAVEYKSRDCEARTVLPAGAQIEFSQKETTTKITYNASRHLTIEYMTRL